MDLIGFETVSEALDNDFCIWFVGWTDGVGNFKIFSNQDTYCFAYEMSVNRADLQTLEYIQAHLKIDVLRQNKLSPEDEMYYQFKISDEREIAKLIVIFEEYSLKTRSKGTQFNIWQEAFYFNLHQAEKNHSFKENMSDYINQLVQAQQKPTILLQKHKRKKDMPVPENQLSLFQKIGFVKGNNIHKK